ncbi:MAG: hypothetical protein A2286_14135 [Gammaproteobacteria bacterium RIFOXYA12_FULL_61_12]|nr:MAG: hypothetical protein A2514_07840 [Gammaproteobacteria bacterium RIFOXYD12_FULL_61_37]OGT89613.1 MAG: hypothetical protein A2286_14135 [Gammaproteobacteria bacterium RIFOXYA12_FULL_61_12]
MRVYLPLLILISSIGMFVFALTQDSYYIDGSNPHAWASAWALFWMGWLGLFYGCFAWIGNPILIASWAIFFEKEYQVGFWASIGAILFMASFLLYKTVVSSEAPSYSVVTGYGLGYWLWVASAGLSAAANLLATRVQLKNGVSDG